MTDAVLLTKIKQGLGIGTEYQDDTMMVYIKDVKAFMIAAGVPQTIVNSEVSVGCILRGVADLWNYGSGNATFSDYFRMRVVQLASQKYAMDVPLMSFVRDIPIEEEADLYGWHTSTSGLTLNMRDDELTVTDEQLIKAYAELPDGTPLTAEDDGTGSRRRILFTSSIYAIVMPETIFDIEQGRFVNNVGTTCLNVRTALNGGFIKIETFYKE